MMTTQTLHFDGHWTDQIALVTGGRGDIGRAVVRALQARGVRVASADLTPLPPTSDEIVGVTEYVLDAADPLAVQEWVAAVSAQSGAPTIAVLAAGIVGSSRLVDTSLDAWHNVLRGCLDAAFVTSTEAIRHMTASGRGGRVVFVGSWAAHAPHPHIGAYSAAKAAVRSLTQTLALDHAGDGILVNEVAPGIVDAGLSRELFARDQALRDRTVGAIPARRMLSTDDVARDVLFLCSPDNHSTTGAVIVNDGGISLASEMNPGRHDESI